MKLKIDFELSPEEARKLMGLPDMGPIWEKAFSESSGLREKLISSAKKNTMKILDPFGILKLHSQNADKN